MRGKERVAMDVTLKQWKSIKSPNERNSPKYLQAGEKVKEKNYQGAIVCFSLYLLKGSGKLHLCAVLNGYIWTHQIGDLGNT